MSKIEENMEPINHDSYIAPFRPYLKKYIVDNIDRLIQSANISFSTREYGESLDGSYLEYLEASVAFDDIPVDNKVIAKDLESKAIADGAKEQSNDEKCAQSETPEVKVGERVAFKHGDEPAEALCGDVIATKGSEAVVEVKQLLGCQAFILPFDDLIVIPPKSQEQSKD